MQKLWTAGQAKQRLMGERRPPRGLVRSCAVGRGRDWVAAAREALGAWPELGEGARSSWGDGAPLRAKAVLRGRGLSHHDACVLHGAQNTLLVP